ncbi:MAG: amino acid ABC transporter substrate-binding protein [Eubacteriales bacterium]|nr:amino acid ABC transporter substrate-binding protein [Eubacteriales bacterium]MDY3332208.1 amino acid ABC transporter substrate-binding protein [Gallibacter sp.]
MKLKKIITATLAFSLVIGSVFFTACGDKKEAAKPEDQTAEKGKLIVGLDDTFAPMGFRDANGKLVGFDIDFANEVGKELGMKIEFKPISWDAKDLELKSKNIDCIWNGMSVTPDRLEAMAISKSYLDNSIILMTLSSKGDVKIADAKDLKKYKIGTQADSAALEVLKKNDEYENYKANITEYGDYDKAILDLKAGRVDVIAIDQVLGEYKSNNMKGELKKLDYILGKDKYAIGFRKDNNELMEAVNDAIKKTIDSGKAEEISKKWFGTNIVIFEESK